MRFAPPAILCTLVAIFTAHANPVITEFMAKNESTAADENGDFSDWVEIHNPTNAPVSLNEWYLTDSATDLVKWRFPNVTLAPGEFRIVWASGKNRVNPGLPLHTSFSLAAGGEYLALVRPDGTTVEQEFAPQFPALDGDESYGSIFQSSVLLAPGASTRYAVPTSSSNPAATWNQTSFSDAAWTSGPSGLGYGLNVPGITARQVFKNGTMGGLSDALALLALPPGDPGILAEATAIVSTANFLGVGSDGRFGNNTASPGGNGNNYAIQLTGTVQIPSAGYYTFGTNADDGSQMKIDGTLLYADDSFHGPEDRFGNRFLSAGPHTFEVVMFQGGGGDCLEFFAAAGQRTSWDAVAFRLVGDTSGGGLAASTSQQGSGEIIATNLESALSGQRGAYFRSSFPATGPGSATALSLVTRHNDGFAAWLNGTKVASDNVPATPAWNSTANSARGNDESLRKTAFNLTSHLPLLANGSNLLAIHGMKDSAANTSFLILPELIAGSLDAGQAPAYYAGGKATPGWINVEPSSLGKVQDTQFSVKRGFFTAPFQVAISSLTPGVIVRYTTDGSTPTDNHGSIYNGPLTISATTVLRARAMKLGWEATDVDTQTYLFLNDVITQSSNGSPAPGWPASSGTGQVLDYGMDPDIVNNGNPDIGGANSVKAALAALPAVSVTTDLPNLFNMNGSQGIYSNAWGRGFAWERPASVEWINPPSGAAPNGTSEFQVNAGLRIRGGFSRSNDNPKHSFRLIFREDYGDKMLDYPLFGRRGAQAFDKIDFRTAQNYSWSFGGDDANTFLREESTRQAMLDMGQPGSRVRYFHLYLNGQYWGLYNLDERPEAAFAESYLGGKSEEYDVVKSEGDNDFKVGAVDGNLSAWQDLWAKGETHKNSPTNANYFRMMGLAADGVTPTADPVLLDPDNLIDYMLLTFWTGNLDGATSAFLGNDRANNWFGSRRRDNNGGQGFQFFAHDFEHSFFNVNEDRTGPFIVANDNDVNYSNPMFLHQDLLANTEYRMAWADRVQKHMFNGGALHPTAWSNRINSLATIVDQSIIAESARWGDAKNSTPKTRQTWINAQSYVLNNYLNPRAPIVLEQLRADNLYPAIDAPVPTPFGGYQDSGVEVVIDGPPGSTLYYMPDGSDPRAVGGAVKPGALVYTSSTTAENLIPWSASGWKYRYDGLNYGTSWRLSGFNDSGWSTGTAELGYGDGDEATSIPIVYPVPGEKAATCYFRRNFNLSDLSNITSLDVTVEYDDAYAVYLNGTRVAGNLPADPAYNYYSGNAIEDTIAATAVNPSLLVNGTNVIAVEVHQAAGSSSDLSMNLSLALTRSTTATPLFLTGAGERVFKVRGKDGATWSAMSEATFLLDTDPATPANLAISEIHYHPADPSPAEITAGFDDADAFEFVEILNTSTRHVDLDGVYFYGAISFNFSGAATGRTLPPGGRVLVVADLDAFQARYGSGKPVAGQYSGQLNNAGENLVLFTPGDSVIRGVDYSDDAPWASAADGAGYSLVRRHPAETTGDSSGEGWTTSGAIGGSPGEADVPASGSFDAWAATTFSAPQLASSAISGLMADPDGDGFQNFAEYALATDPMVADQPDTTLVWSQNGPDTHAALRVRRPENPANVLYELLADDDLGSFPAVATLPVSTTPLGGGLEHAVFRDVIPATGPRRFLRLRVTWVP